MSCYLCEVCGFVFAQPSIHRYTDLGPDDIRIPYRQEICPECGEGDIVTLTGDQGEAP